MKELFKHFDMPITVIGLAFVLSIPIIAIAISECTYKTACLERQCPEGTYSKYDENVCICVKP